ncbi:MAG: phosphoglycerate kinase, partial [Chloroflexota bacterium]
MNKQTLRDADLSGKRVLVRVDFNVPISDGVVKDDTRVRAAVPTLQHILEQKPQSVLLMSHLGRPKGERKLELSLKPVADVLSEHMGVDVSFAGDTVGDVVSDAVQSLPEGGVLLLENTRFYKGETKNDPDLAAHMAEQGDVFVNDAFGTAHRAHASNVGVTAHLPAYAGLLLEKEIDYLANTIEDPKRPFIAILGGAKVSDKIGVIEALLSKVDTLLIGGGMANTFFKAQGIETANSLVEEDAVETASKLLAQGGDKIMLPVDAVLGDKFDAAASTQAISVADGVPDGWSIFDIGTETLKAFEAKLSDVNTVVWNGPMGVFELDPFSGGTFGVARALATATERGATTIIGGGDSAAAIEKADLADKVTHVSTGGGASLEMLEGK